MKPKKVLLQETLDAFNRIEARISSIERLVIELKDQNEYLTSLLDIRKDPAR